MSNPATKPGYELPERTTRGKRLRAALDDEEEAADTDFWNQEFFAEDVVDVDFAPEQERVSDAEDVPDSDFDESEDDDDDEEGEEVREQPKKKTLRPPGYQKPVKAGASKATAKAVKTEDGDSDEEGGDVDDKEGADAEVPATDGGAPSTSGRPSPTPAVEAPSYEAPQLRRSTVQRVSERERERERLEKLRGKRAKPKANTDWRPMTQQELLAEAARTEIDNLTSLRALLAMEEEVKRRAVIIKKKHMGPSLRMLSRKVDGHEQTLMELCNMHGLPSRLPNGLAPFAAFRSSCAITGKPARYRDSKTGLPFADLEAYRCLHGLPSGTASEMPSLLPPPVPLPTGPLLQPVAYLGPAVADATAHAPLAYPISGSSGLLLGPVSGIFGGPGDSSAAIAQGGRFPPLAVPGAPLQSPALMMPQLDAAAVYPGMVVSPQGSKNLPMPPSQSPAAWPVPAFGERRPPQRRLDKGSNQLELSGPRRALDGRGSSGGSSADEMALPPHMMALVVELHASLSGY